MNRSLTRTFSVPSDAVRAGDFAGLAPICDPRRSPHTGSCTPFANNQIPAERIDPIAAAFLQHVPRATSAAPSQNLTSVEESTRDIDQFSVRIDHRLTSADQVFARFSTFDADELQPFGTSALQETLVPGFGRTLGTADPEPHREPDAHVRQLAAERVPLRLDEGRWRTGEPQRRRRLRGTGGPAGRDAGPARCRLPSDLDGRTLQHDGRSDLVHLPPQPALRALRQLHDRPRRTPLQVRRLLLPPAAPARAAGQRTRRVHLHRAVQRQRVRRFPARISDLGDIRHRPRRRGRPHQLAAPVRAGRLADARQPHRQRRPAIRIQPAHVRCEQSAVIDRSVRAGRPIRDRQRRATATSVPTRRRCCR